MALWIRSLIVMALLLHRAYLLGVNGDCDPLVVETDSLLAERTQQQHLHALFLKYGENGTISLSGLRRLLEGLGVDRIRRVTVQHHGNKHDHTHSHEHSLTHAHKHATHMHSVGSKKDGDSSSVEKSDSTSSVHPDSISMKKSQSDIHHNLYLKRDSDATAILTTPSYVTKSRWTERSADYLMDSDSTQPNTTHLNVTYYSENTSTHSLDNHNHHDKDSPLSYNFSQECQNATMILQTHGMSQEMTLSVKDFSFLCPALLVQIDFKSCLLHAENQSEYKEHFHLHHDTVIGKGQKISSIPMYLLLYSCSVCILLHLKRVAVKLERALFYATMTDLWSSHTIQSFIKLMVHHISEDWTLHTVGLQTCHFPDDHTGEVISQWLKDALASWKLGEV